jgi:hypothetical protein
MVQANGWLAAKRQAPVRSLGVMEVLICQTTLLPFERRYSTTPFGVADKHTPSDTPMTITPSYVQVTIAPWCVKLLSLLDVSGPASSGYFFLLEPSKLDDLVFMFSLLVVSVD